MAQNKQDLAATAKLLVVLLAFAWGFNWIAAAVALREISPWSLRFAGSGHRRRNAVRRGGPHRP